MRKNIRLRPFKIISEIRLKISEYFQAGSILRACCRYQHLEYQQLRQTAQPSAKVSISPHSGDAASTSRKHCLKNRRSPDKRPEPADMNA